MQSGISASKELVAEFNEFLSNPSAFALVITISNESLEPVTRLLSIADASADAASAFDANLAQLVPHLTPKTALYLLLRRHDAPPPLVAVTYVPDAAPVRQKMLFASTRLALVRELGSEHFRSTIIANDPAELSPRGFAAADAHAALDAPLTQEERSLGDVRRAENEFSSGTSSKALHLAKNIAVPLAPPALDALKEMAADGDKVLVVLKINPDTETVELAPEGLDAASISELARALPSDEPRFSFFRHRASPESATQVLFFYSCPTTAAGAPRAIKTRMMYPLMKRTVLDAATEEAGLQVDHKFEVGDATDITPELVDHEINPMVELQSGFRRPKRPGR